MAIYDIIHIEDDPIERRLFEKTAKREGMSFFGVGFLNELEKCLANENRAKVYVIDGNFPETEGGRILPLAPKALEMIRNSHLESNIILYSSNDLSKIAEEKNAEYINKSIVTGKLMEKIKQMIGK